ncbi:MAG: bifunctional phosphopantothenoylcysteine decarboxylase/phosphopantothenate--cysteine ligase CoaBC [Acidobacteriota bacterium]|nr:bifunctional phosphopantothenoylcysteine decarboxylase/phosphopantothenate--cysteine ligase CoaBC [Acidobacteriota bacterium]
MRVLLGVCGGIAAYKAAELVRLLRAADHDVRCALTRGAESFVTPLTLEVLSGYRVYRQEYLNPNDSGEELHVEAARWAELLCVAPATAHTLGKLALGLADDFLTTTALGFEGPVLVAPAMHSTMWMQPAVQANAQTLRERGVSVLGPSIGALASGDTGVGRLVDLGVLVREVDRFRSTGELAGKRVLVTAGPTREALDPVRFLSNRSSGRMGFALAAEAVRRGADVQLVAGPVELPTPRGVERCDVVSAAEMRVAVEERAAAADLIVMAAAVGDLRPGKTSARKLKKSELGGELALARTADILAGLAESAPDAVRVGFAAETENLEAEAIRKLEQKQAQFIVANDVSRADIGFGQSDNEVTVFRSGAEPVHVPKASKPAIARAVFDLVVPAVLARGGATKRAAR